MILYSGRLYTLLSGPLKLFERRDPHRESAIDTIREAPAVDVILVGLGNYGSALVEYLLRWRRTVIGVDFDPASLGRWRTRGMAVLYGDMGDPEIHEHLPLTKARWVVSTVRSVELNLALVQHLKGSGYRGKVALTATDQEEAELFEKSGAHVVFRPFADAAEQAAAALTHAMDFLPDNVNWPITFLEIRVLPEALVVGQAIRDIPLRSFGGVSILAVSRAGRVYYDPGPDFQIYPGDRLVIMGPPEGLKEAEDLLGQLESRDDGAGSDDRFEIAEIRVGDNSERAGQTLAELRFRQRYGVTVIGIRRGDERITAVTPAEKILAGDCLIVIGGSHRLRALRQEEPL